MAIMRVVVTGLILGQRCQNVLHFLNADGALTEDACFAEIRDNWVTPLRSLQNAGLTNTSVTVQKVDGTPGLVHEYPLSSSTGSLSGAAAPPVLCGLFSIRTAFPGRHGHGRFYMYGVHQDSVSNGVNIAVSAYVTVANTLANRFKVSGTGPLVLGVCPRASPSDFHGMTSLIVRATWGIQRRRNIGVGG